MGPGSCTALGWALDRQVETGSRWYTAGVVQGQGRGSAPHNPPVAPADATRDLRRDVCEQSRVVQRHTQVRLPQHAKQRKATDNAAHSQGVRCAWA